MKFTFQCNYTVVKTNRRIAESQPDLESSEVAAELKKAVDRANSGEIKLQSFVVMPVAAAATTAALPLANNAKLPVKR